MDDHHTPDDETDSEHENSEATASNAEADAEDLSEQSDDVDDEAPAATNAPASAVPEIVRHTQPGLIRGLTKGLGVNTTLLLAITKTSETELLVTIQPPAGEKAFGAAALPLQVSGSPEEIDGEMLEALAHYAPAREFVASVAKDIAERSAAAAQRAKDDADKKRVSVPTPAPKPKGKSEKLLVTVKPRGATLTVVNANNASQNVELGKRATLPLGKYTITAKLDGYDTHTTTLNLAKAEKLDIILKQSEPSLLAGLEVAK
jgi:PRTRC genetic system protein E